MDKKEGQPEAGLGPNREEIKAEVTAGAEIEEKLEKIGETGEAELSGRETRQAEAELGELQNGEQIEKETTPKRTNAGLITLVVVLALLLVAAVGWGVWQMTQNGREEAETGTGAGAEKDEDDKDEGDGEEAGADTKIEEVALDDPVVQRLWHNFDSKMLDSSVETVGVMSPFEPLGKFYTQEGALSSDGLADKYKYAIAIQNYSDYRHEGEMCRGDYDFLTWTDGAGIVHPSTEAKACYSGDTIRGKIKEIFGDEISLAQFDGLDVIVMGEGWMYSAENDEIVNRASGATAWPISRVLLKAERDPNQIYLYEAVGHVGCWMMGQEVCNSAKLDGIEIPNSSEITLENMGDYADRFDQFKWTFRKNADGEYIYAGIERL